MHHQDADHIIAARLTGAASRLAGWNPPTGKARAAAVAELTDIATVTPKPPRGSPHQPAPQLRADLLAEVAGILLGAAPDDHPEQNRIAADLLRDAGADEDLIQQWIPVGRKRRESGGPAFSRSEPIGWAR